MDLNILDIKNYQKPEKGCLLISEPYSSDNLFNRTIVLLTEHGDDGSVGFILNKSIDMNVTEAVEDFPEFESKLSIGGPVSPDSIFYIHTLGHKISDSVHIVDDYYWGGNFIEVEAMIKLGRIKNTQIRFFIGYSGWAPGQLDDEIKKQYWLISDLVVDNFITADVDKLWKTAVQNKGGKYAAWSNFPENPTHN